LDVEWAIFPAAGKIFCWGSLNCTGASYEGFLRVYSDDPTQVGNAENNGQRQDIEIFATFTDVIESVDSNVALFQVYGTAHNRRTWVLLTCCGMAYARITASGIVGFPEEFCFLRFALKLSDNEGEDYQTRDETAFLRPQAELVPMMTLL